MEEIYLPGGDSVFASLTDINSAVGVFVVYQPCCQNHEIWNFYEFLVDSCPSAGPADQSWGESRVRQWKRRGKNRQVSLRNEKKITCFGSECQLIRLLSVSSLLSYFVQVSDEEPSCWFAFITGECPITGSPCCGRSFGFQRRRQDSSRLRPFGC